MKGNHETLSRRVQTYESPNLEVVEIDVENVICQASGTFGIDDWGTDEDGLDF